MALAFDVGMRLEWNGIGKLMSACACDPSMRADSTHSIRCAYAHPSDMSNWGVRIPMAPATEPATNPGIRASGACTCLSGAQSSSQPSARFAAACGTHVLVDSHFGGGAAVFHAEATSVTSCRLSSRASPHRLIIDKQSTHTEITLFG